MVFYIYLGRRIAGREVDVVCTKGSQDSSLHPDRPRPPNDHCPANRPTNQHPTTRQTRRVKSARPAKKQNVSSTENHGRMRQKE